MTRLSKRPRVPRRAAWFSLHGAPDRPADLERSAPRWAIVLAGLLGLGLALVALGPHRIGDYSTETDFYGSYAEGARLLQQGRVDPSRYGVIGPVYETALALVGFAVPDLFSAAEWLSIAAALATLLLWFHLIRRRIDARHALLAALFIVTNPYFFRYGYTASSDGVATALQAGALFLTLGTTGRPTAWMAGLLASLAFLTRYNAIYLLPGGALACLGLRPGHRDRRDALRFVVGFAVPALGWTLYGLARGEPPSIQLHHNVAYEAFARPRGISWDEYERSLEPQFPTLWAVISRDPGALILRWARNVPQHLILDARVLLGWPIAACATGGALLIRDGTRLGVRLAPLGLAGFLLFLTLVPVFHSERYSLPLLPFYAALAAVFFGSPRFALSLGRGRLWLKPALATIPLALSLAASVRLQRQVLAQQPVEALECAETLRALRRPGDRVIARKPHVAYLSGVEPTAFPFVDGLPALADYARRQGARWLFYGWPEAESRPALRHLLDTTGTVPGLQVRRATHPRPAVLYEIGPGFGRRPAWYDNDTLVSLHDARVYLMSHPDDVRALASAGLIERDREMLREAREHLDRAARLDRENIDLLLPLGEVLLRLGDLTDAALAYERVEQLAPGNVEARVGRGWVSLAGGRRAEAAALWRSVIRATRNRPTLERMVQVYRAVGDAEAAAEAQAALATLPSAR